MIAVVVHSEIKGYYSTQVVSTSYDSMVCVWDLETGEKVIQVRYMNDT